ncbi:hypothetical protein Phum_PHUM227510 [Pediculus humanus corporis]|uniref:Uncharacterized protein n=1 Tax=Pediculus humanus subsp. corporis TaxID=121224 RepID=E0VIG7_PEDHC|nr:uncharacterized protein Phum_PHUM227510 [Pediculus humanus corporis]EEB13173.1 hypothetical protein Phum_PHUM227510 [Pediculus humanus corporis]
MGGGGGGGSNTDDEMKKIEKIDYITNIIWNSIEKKKKHYGNETTAATGTATTTTKPEPTEEEIEQDKLEAEELQEIKKIADVIDMEPNLPGASTIGFLRRCASFMNAISNIMLMYVKRQNNPQSHWTTRFIQRLREYFQTKHM